MTFEIEVTRFDAQDVIATSGTPQQPLNICPTMKEGNPNIYHIFKDDSGAKVYTVVGSGDDARLVLANDFFQFIYGKTVTNNGWHTVTESDTASRAYDDCPAGYDHPIQ